MVSFGRVLIRWSGLFVVCFLAACATGNANLASDGLPHWIDQACAGMPANAICAVGESDFVRVDVEAGKTDAETAAKNRIAEQLETKVGLLTERLMEAMRDLSSGKDIGQRSIKQINQNFQVTRLQGLRYQDYFFYPNRIEPRKVYVRAVVTIESSELSQEIVNAMMAEATAQKLQMKHEDAQARFDAVRKQYLAEEAAKAPQQ